LRSHIAKLALVFSVFIGSSILGSESFAAENPEIKLIAPQVGNIIVPDASFTVTLQLLGGWAATEKSCELGQSSGNRTHSLVYFAIGSIDETGNGLFWNFGGDVAHTTMFMKTKIIPNGLECSFTTFEGDNGSWRLTKEYGMAARNQGITWLNLPGESNSVGEIKKVIVSWGFQDGPIGTREFTAGVPAAPVFKFEGVNRGDIVNYYKKYFIDTIIGNKLTPVEINGSGKCNKFRKINSNDIQSTYRSTCIVRVDHHEDDTTEIQAEVITEDGQTFKSESIPLNVGKKFHPIISIESARTEYSEKSKPGNGTVLNFYLRGRFFLDKVQSSENISNFPFDICISGKCEIVKTDKDGFFQISKDVVGTKVNYSINGIYDGLKITKNNLAGRTGYSDDFNENGEYAEIAGELLMDKMPSPPKTYVSKISIVKASVPKSVKWGSTFTLRLTAKGKGGAKCEAYYQSTYQSGVFPFRIKAGSTSSVTIRPTYYGLKAWPLAVACAPDGFPPLAPLSPRISYNLGTVTLTN